MLNEHDEDNANDEHARRDPPERQAVRAPWKWERLLAESRVVASEQRWERRLNGLANECELQRRELARTEPGSPRIDHLTRKTEDIRQLAAFALPIMRRLAAGPLARPGGNGSITSRRSRRRC